jgi:hypothetical protein
MPDSANEPAAVPVPPPGIPDALPVEPARASEPAAVLAPPRPVAGPAAGRRGALLLGIGALVGLAVGVVLTLAVSDAYRFVTHTVPETREEVEIFNQLNELRQQVNQMNEEQKLKDQEKEDALRQALRAVETTAHPPGKPPESGTPSADMPASKGGERGEVRPPARPHDEFAEIDDEIKRLEQTQKVLNTILDVFSRKEKERAKER